MSKNTFSCVWGLVFSLLKRKIIETCALDTFQSCNFDDTKFSGTWYFPL